MFPHRIPGALRCLLVLSFLAVGCLADGSSAAPGILGFSDSAEASPRGVASDGVEAPAIDFEPDPAGALEVLGSFDPVLDMPNLQNPGSPAHEGGNCFGICRAAWAHWVHHTRRGRRDDLAPSDLAEVWWRRDAHALSQLRPTNATAPGDFRLHHLLTADLRRDSNRRVAQILANQWQGAQDSRHRARGDSRASFRALLSGLREDGLVQLSLRQKDGAWGHAMLVYAGETGWARGVEGPGLVRAVRFELADPNLLYREGARHRDRFLLYLPTVERFHVAGPDGVHYHQGGLVAPENIGTYRPLRATDRSMDAGPFVPLEDGRPGRISGYFW